MKKFSFRNVEISQKFWLAFGSNKKINDWEYWLEKSENGNPSSYRYYCELPKKK